MLFNAFLLRHIPYFLSAAKDGYPKIEHNSSPKLGIIESCQNCPALMVSAPIASLCRPCAPSPEPA